MEDTISLVDQSPCFGFFAWPCYSRILLYISNARKTRCSNIAAGKNQGNQRELDDH